MCHRTRQRIRATRAAPQKSAVELNGTAFLEFLDYQVNGSLNQPPTSLPSTAYAQTVPASSAQRGLMDVPEGTKPVRVGTLYRHRLSGRRGSCLGLIGRDQLTKTCGDLRMSAS